MSFMKRIFYKYKDKLYHYFVEQNGCIRNEYVPYVNMHRDEHLQKPWKHWWILFKLNLHYRVYKKTEILLANTKIESRNIPILDNAESLVYKRTPHHQMAKGLLNYDLISFDIFDTLILRALDQPRDVFTLVGEKLNCIGFYDIRLQAEREARERKFINEGNREVTIYEIYNCIEERTGIKKEVGIKAEFDVEKSICFANPYMKNIFEILKSKHKKIVATSDMYYPLPIMKELLHSCGYDGFENIIVSCDYKGSKSSGYLFDVLKNNVFENAKIVHIGDNVKADIQAANNAGIDTRYYKSCRDIGNVYREKGMSALIKSSYNGIINTTIHNGSKQYNPAYEYGFIYGGIFVLGYVRWIHEQAKKDGVNKILFLSRDGYIYKQVYDLLYNDIPSEYIFWSRISSLKYGFKYNFNDFVNRMVNHKIKLKVKIIDILDSLDLGDLSVNLQKYGLERNEILHSGNKKQLEKFFIDNIEFMNEVVQKSERYAREYYSLAVKECSKVALVDTGWRGDNQIVLKRLLVDRWGNNCNVKCYMAGSILGERNIVEIEKNNLKCYMFSSLKNRNLFDSFIKNVEANMALFELFSQAPHPSFAGFDNDGRLKFNYAEVENYEIIEQILMGEIDFCKKYISKFKNYEYMFNISGYDAYIPFRGLTRNYSFAKCAVGDFKFQQTVGTSKDENVKTLSKNLKI